MFRVFSLTGLFAPVTGLDQGPRPVSRVAVRRYWPVRRPVPFSGQLFPWSAYGVAPHRSRPQCRLGSHHPRRHWGRDEVLEMGPGCWCGVFVRGLVLPQPLRPLWGVLRLSGRSAAAIFPRLLIRSWTRIVSHVIQ